MSKNNLVPKHITDKNGVQTTRWVKPDAGSSNSKQIPAPAAIKQEQMRETPHMDILFGQSRLSYSTMTIKDLDPNAVATVEGLIERAVSDDPFASAATNMRSFVSNALKSIAENGYDDHSEFNNVAALGESVAFSGSRTDNSIYLYTNGIASYFSGVNDFYKEASDEQLMQARALCRLTASLPYKYLEEYMGYDEFNEDDNIEDHADDDEALYYTKIRPDLGELVDLVMEQPENVSDIISIIRERDSADVGMLKQVLNHREAALKEGTL